MRECSPDTADLRTLLKLNAYYAYPALSNGEPQEPYVSTCVASCHAMVTLTALAREIGWNVCSTPFFIWSCWVAARVSFGKTPPSPELTPVHAFLTHQLQPDDEFDTIVGALRDQARYWALASEHSFTLHLGRYWPFTRDAR